MNDKMYIPKVFDNIDKERTITAIDCDGNKTEITFMCKALGGFRHDGTRYLLDGHYFLPAEKGQEVEFNEETSEKDPDASPDDEGYYGDERERTFNSTNLLDFDPDRASGFYQMPVLKAEMHIPKDLISFNYVLNTDAFEKGVHFYIDDYQFERVWNDPHKYMDRLKQFDCMLTPDFSLYMEMPKAMQIWNIYRSRLIGQIAQDEEIRVIPTLSWADAGSFKFCFDGIEPGGVVSVSTIGVKKDKEAMKIWTAGMNEAIKRLTPSHVIVYGGDIGYKFPCKVTYIDNHNVALLQENVKKK